VFTDSSFEINLAPAAFLKLKTILSDAPAHGCAQQLLT